MPVDPSALPGVDALFWYVAWLTAVILSAAYGVFRQLSKQVDGVKKEVKGLSEGVGRPARTNGCP